MKPYNVIAIGGGTAGLVTTAAVAGLGGRAALIERNKMGGDCLNFGCVPSKSLISSARLAQSIRDADKWGLEPAEPVTDFQKVFASMREQRAVIEPNDSAERFRSLGVDVYEAEARFVSPHEVKLSTGERLKARHIVITAGSRAGVPPIPGIDDIPYYTNETIFDQLDEKPDKLIIIGGGPIGTELGQTFNRLGVEVHQIELTSQILSREDPDVAEVMMEKLHREGVHIHTVTKPERFYLQDGRIHLDMTGPEGSRTLDAGAVLVAAGRVPNLDKLNLEAAGIAHTKKGITVNRKLQTSVPHIWAAGDIAGGLQFTHLADFHARHIVGNILKPFPFLYSEFDDSLIPWSTYTEPEVGRVGLNEKEAKDRDIAYEVWQVPFSEVDRAITERATDGFVKILTEQGSDKILGATVVGLHGGDLLHEIVLAMKHGIGLKGIASTIHAYPTLAEVMRKVGDKYNRSRLTPRVAGLLRWLFQRQLKGLK
ncbi:MAG: mercuric reductase [Opitutales bacterium]